MSQLGGFGVRFPGSIEVVVSLFSWGVRVALRRGTAKHEVDLGPDTLVALLKGLPAHPAVAAELNTWKRLAIARGNPHAFGSRQAAIDACDALRVMGIDVLTGERIAAEEPR